MAGRGPAPKDPSTRARRNAGPAPLRTVDAQTIEPQALSDDLLPEGDVWHPATVRWWRRWCESNLVGDLLPVDWSELEACAVLHHEYMRKRSFTLASELRLRMAKFGATPEDRARLRIQVVAADEAEEKPARRVAASQYGSLKSLGGRDAVAGS